MSHKIHFQIKKIEQIYKRYKVASTFAMLYHEKELSLKVLSELVRFSDKLIKFDDHHYFIVFTYTQEHDAYRGAANLLYNLDKYFENTTTYIAVDTLDANNSPKIVLSRLTQILEEIKKHSYLRVASEDIFDEY